MGNFILIIDKSLCNNCMDCIEVCEEDVLELDGGGNINIGYLDYCMGCGDCVKSCKENAISLSDAIDISGKRCSYKK